jgi:hypothetical protein
MAKWIGVSGSNGGLVGAVGTEWQGGIGIQKKKKNSAQIGEGTEQRKERKHERKKGKKGKEDRSRKKKQKKNGSLSYLHDWGTDGSSNRSYLSTDGRRRTVGRAPDGWKTVVLDERGSGSNWAEPGERKSDRLQAPRMMGPLFFGRFGLACRVQCSRCGMGMGRGRA